MMGAEVVSIFLYLHFIVSTWLKMQTKSYILPVLLLIKPCLNYLDSLKLQSVNSDNFMVIVWVQQLISLGIFFNTS